LIIFQLPGTDLEKLISQLNIAEIYNKYFKEIIAVLAKELSNNKANGIIYIRLFFI